MIWGASLAAGAQAYRLLGAGPEAQARAVVASTRVVESFRALTGEINCLEITHLDTSSTTMQMVTFFLLKGGVIGCFHMAAQYAPIAFREIGAALAEDRLVPELAARADLDDHVARAVFLGVASVVAVLFAIGSTCFLVGPIPAFEDAVGMTATDATFFIGSIFFTTASYLSYMQVVRAGGRRWLGWTPQLMGFWATFIQLVGTVFFNVTTLAALVSLTRPEAEQYVWRPDAYGSVCFLVASAIAFAEAGHRWFSWRPGKRDWHITALNMWGSVFFGLSAIGAYVDPDGQMISTRWANGGTLLGAACFLAASILMFPEGRHPATDHD
jgi:hypothetical protein